MIINYLKKISVNSPVGRILGWLLLLESILLLLPFTLNLLNGEEMRGFAAAVLVSGAAGGIGAWLFRGSEGRLFRRDAFLVITLVWILFSLVSMIPFMLDPKPLSAASAFFESISGFTTTGATVIADVESHSKGLLLWRAMTQWIGGLGIVFFLIALLPSLNDSGGIMMFNAEITGITHDKLHPRIKQTAMSLWIIYAGLTVVLILLLLCGGMSFYDSVCQAMATLSTGGFSTRNSGIAWWGSSYISFVLSIFMFLGGVNFILLYNACHGRVKELLGNEVFRFYSAIVIVSTVVFAVCYGISDPGAGIWDMFVGSFFHVTSAITSTGFSYSDYSKWGSIALQVTVLLMMAGACAGSTTGAIKVDRVLALIKNIGREAMLTVYPHHVSKLRLGGSAVSDGVMMRVGAFLAIYLLLFIAGSLVMSMYGYDPFDCIFASASCIGNNGLGYGATGSGFGELPDPVKWFFSGLMLIGRLEIFPVISLLIPSFWQRK